MFYDTICSAKALAVPARSGGVLRMDMATVWLAGLLLATSMIVAKIVGRRAVVAGLIAIVAFVLLATAVGFFFRPAKPEFDLVVAGGVALLVGVILAPRRFVPYVPKAVVAAASAPPQETTPAAPYAGPPQLGPEVDEEAFRQWLSAQNLKPPLSPERLLDLRRQFAGET